MSLYRWLDERYDLGPIARFLQHKEVPVGAHSMLYSTSPAFKPTFSQAAAMAASEIRVD